MHVRLNSLSTVRPPTVGKSLHCLRSYSVRRWRELHIPSWGRVELSRGSSNGDLDQIEADLRRCHEEFAAALASFGIAANDPDAFDQLLRRIAEHGLKSAELQKQKQELKKFAPDGLEPLQSRVLELESKAEGRCSVRSRRPGRDAKRARGA